MCEILNIIGRDRANLRIDVRGIVQGVGFRPFIHRLVERHGLTGWVRNSSEGAELELEGPGEELAAFLRELETEAPPLALIESVSAREPEQPAHYEDFRIIPSERGETMRTLVSPDVGICPDCLRELQDPADRRYRYPFINCTNSTCLPAPAARTARPIAAVVFPFPSPVYKCISPFSIRSSFPANRLCLPAACPHSSCHTPSFFLRAAQSFLSQPAQTDAQAASSS